VASYRKIDDMTVEVKTKVVDALFPYQMLWFLVSSPAQFERLGRDWNKFASEPSGTGPFKLARLVPRERAELVKNEAYWNSKRMPKADRMILVVAPEGATRTAALLSGQVDLIETPTPDTVDRLTKSGMKIVQNVTPHVWNYHPSMLPGSPWTDIRLRKAANLAIDRNAIVQLLGGLAPPAFGQEPLKTKFVVASGGSGQMLSLPMNEAIQQMFKDVYIDLEFKVVELEALYTAWRAGAKAEMNKDVTANNVAYVTSDPLYAFTRFFASNQAAPVGVNWSNYASPEVDKLIDQALAEFDPAKQDAIMAKVHEKVVDDAVLIWVVHDTNPHALSPKIKSYIQAQHCVPVAVGREVDLLAGAVLGRPGHEAGRQAAFLGGAQVVVVGGDQHHLVRLQVHRPDDAEVGLGIGLVVAEGLAREAVVPRDAAVLGHVDQQRDVAVAERRHDELLLHHADALDRVRPRAQLVPQARELPRAVFAGMLEAAALQQRLEGFLVQLVDVGPGDLALAHPAHLRLVEAAPVVGEAGPVGVEAVLPAQHRQVLGEAAAPVDHRAEHVEDADPEIRGNLSHDVSSVAGSVASDGVLG